MYRGPRSCRAARRPTRRNSYVYAEDHRRHRTDPPRRAPEPDGHAHGHWRTWSRPARTSTRPATGRVECWGGATFDSCIRFLNEDPWERLRTFRKLHAEHAACRCCCAGRTCSATATTRTRVVDRFVEKAAENGMDVFRVFDALNDIRNLRRADRGGAPHRQARAGHHLLHDSPLHTIADFVEMAEQLARPGLRLDLHQGHGGAAQAAAGLRHRARASRRRCGDRRARPRPRARHHRRHAGEPDEGDRGGRRLRGHVPSAR